MPLRAVAARPVATGAGRRCSGDQRDQWRGHPVASSRILQGVGRWLCVRNGGQKKAWAFTPTATPRPTNQTPPQAPSAQKRTTAATRKDQRTRPAAGTTRAGNPRAAAAATADQDPDPHDRHGPDPRNGRRGGPETNDTQPDPARGADATNRTQANDRPANRARTETDGPPPAHHATEPPARTTGTNDAGAADAGQTPNPAGPKAEKTKRDGAAPAAKTEATTAASAPEAQPDATDRRPHSADPTSAETAAKDPPANDRAPLNPTTGPAGTGTEPPKKQATKRTPKRKRRRNEKQQRSHFFS